MRKKLKTIILFSFFYCNFTKTGFCAVDCFKNTFTEAGAKKCIESLIANSPGLSALYSAASTHGGGKHLGILHNCQNSHPSGTGSYFSSTLADFQQSFGNIVDCVDGQSMNRPGTWQCTVSAGAKNTCRVTALGTGSLGPHNILFSVSKKQQGAVITFYPT